MKDAIAVIRVKGKRSLQELERALDECGLEMEKFISDEEMAQQFTEALRKTTDSLQKSHESRTKEREPEPVTMRERPRSTTTPGGALTTASKQLIALVERCMTERKLGYIKASEVVARENPALYQEWLVESYTEAGQQRAAQIQAAENARQGGVPERATRQVRTTANEKLVQAIDLVMRDRNMSHEEATAFVCRERPDLYENYHRETYGSGTPIPGMRMMPGEEVV